MPFQDTVVKAAQSICNTTWFWGPFMQRYGIASSVGHLEAAIHCPAPLRVLLCYPCSAMADSDAQQELGYQKHV